MNDSRRTGLLRLRHLREITEAKAEEMETERERFRRLNSDESRPRTVVVPQLFQTPEPLAARLASMFGTFGRTLEPSAGLGRLYRAIRNVSTDCPIVLVEQSNDCCRELYGSTNGDLNAQLVQGDFLTMGESKLGTFDTILMNPPFKMGTDAKHVRHAMSLLRPGGRLVSLCANGPRQRASLQPIASQWIELPSGSFRSEGTNVEAAIVVIDRGTQ
jgi:SAM-dependent methyltransferase